MREKLKREKQNNDEEDDEEINDKATNGLYYKHRIVEDFIKRNKYPKYNEVVKIISDKLDVFAEYGGFNHEWMNKIWDDINNEKKIRVIGNLINSRGGFQAMSCNHETLMIVVRHFLKKEKLTDIDNMIILQSINKSVKQAWDGIGDWRQ